MSSVGIDVDFGDDEPAPGPLSELEIPDGYLSNSRVAKYLRCGENFRRTYVEGHRWRGNAATSVGKSVHSLVENTLRNYMRKGVPRPLEAGLDEADSTTNDILDNTEMVGDDKDIPRDDHLSKVRRAYTAWHTLRAPDVVPIAVEYEFDQRVRGIRVKGIIDLIDAGSGVPSVIDLKITKRKKSEGEARNSLQLSLYANVTGHSTVGFDSVVENASGVAVHMVRASLTPTAVAWVGTLVENVAKSISAGVFPLSDPEAWWCSEKFCPFWFECRGKGG